MNQARICIYRTTRSISVSGQLPTYPSPKPTLTLSCHPLTVVGLGEGLVGSCPDTVIDPNHSYHKNLGLVFTQILHEKLDILV